MSLKHISLIFIGLGIFHLGWSTPSVEIIQSCKNSKPANASITVTRLLHPDVRDDAEAGCEDKYALDFNNHIYGSVTCNNEPYVFFDSQKIKLNAAENLSINPSVKPDDLPLPITTDWWKIDKNDASFACILTSLSDSGVGAGRLKYYIIENAFSENGEKKIYFYFFDRDVMPLSLMD
jgi:hypothetical protein